MKKKVILATLTSNVDNPRYIKEDKFKKLCKSIEEFPEMLSLRPMLVDENGVILAGNMRHKALTHLGHENIPGEWVKVVKGLTPEQKQELVIKDNVGFGSWDWDMLANNWDQGLLKEWGMDIFVPEDIDIDGMFEDAVEKPEKDTEKLTLEFLLEDYKKVEEKLAEFQTTKEQTILDLLGI